MINKTILLASKSPRRKEILAQSDLLFKIVNIEASEDYPSDLDHSLVAEYIAKSKAAAYTDSMAKHEILLTADTIVLHNNRILGKPIDKAEAIAFLESLSDASHKVMTGVVLKNNELSYSFTSVSEVEVAPLTTDEIINYVDKYKPMDKAGAYGIQEWFGVCKIKSIKGSYLNIVGLPMEAVYTALNRFI